MAARAAGQGDDENHAEKPSGADSGGGGEEFCAAEAILRRAVGILSQTR